ncbi:hypothetical protein MTZ49_11300 [Entomomonas sp. E2T0]|uniref:hypothetical protein n=1 Tax=Entomomonas sp. E2T0 TaxID=2930213 RepID=UPI002228365C|nr:hypothetical protein [Entomomonas sp. E2T0]UYZ83183.1 hypothetical protein MTZ49_11300 [Entomomonas sp. E2T0]
MQTNDRKIIGIDPSCSGSIVVLEKNLSYVSHLLMPTFKTGKSSRVNGAEVASFLNQYDDAFNELDKLIGDLTEENIQDKNELQEKYNEIKDKLETAQNKIIELETSGAILETPFFELLGMLERLKEKYNFKNVAYERILVENMDVISEDLENRLKEAGYFNDIGTPSVKLINSLSVANFIRTLDEENERLRKLSKTRRVETITRMKEKNKLKD